MGIDQNAPSDFSAVLGKHLRIISDLRDLPTSQSSKAVFILNITGATTDSSGAVISAGKGTLHGPLDLEADKNRLYEQWPTLRKRLETPSTQSLRIIAVTCSVQPRNKSPMLHRAVIGLPALFGS